MGSCGCKGLIKLIIEYQELIEKREKLLETGIDEKELEGLDEKIEQIKAAKEEEEAKTKRKKR